jgi:hypothetical protein
MRGTKVARKTTAVMTAARQSSRALQCVFPVRIVCTDMVFIDINFNLFLVNGMGLLYTESGYGKRIKVKQKNMSDRRG